MLVELNQLVYDLHFVETNKQMFSLPRAFNEASEVLDHLFQKLLKKHGKNYLDDLLKKIQTKKEKNQDLATQCNIVKKKMIEMHDFKEESLKKKVKRFKSAETIIGFLDILIPA